MNREGVIAVALILIGLALVPAQSLALGIDFAGFAGGSLTYAGGSTPLIGSDLPIGLVFNPGGSTVLGVSGGELNLVTGSYLSGSNAGPGFQSTYAGGGAVTITGAVPGAGITNPNTTLMTATFNGPATLQYYDFGIGSFVGGLNVTQIDSSLLSYFGLDSFVGAGSLAQVDFALDFNGPSAGFGTGETGRAFSGMQGSVNVLATTPEPGSLLLLGLGLSGLGLWGRARHLKQKVARQRRRLESGRS